MNHLTSAPFYFHNHGPACLLIHGFTGAPREMQEMGEHLAQNGCRVLGIRLFGHATQPADMNRARWQDWVANVEDGWYLLGGEQSRPFLIGLSMGGALALLAASRLPTAGVIAMSTPYRLPPDPRLPLLRWLHPVYPFAPKGKPDWVDLSRQHDHVTYPVYPTRALLELEKLLAEMRAALPQVTAPTLLMHAREDQGVAPANMDEIHTRLGSEDKTALLIENSGHVLTRDAARAEVFRLATAFIKDHGATADG